MAKNPKRYSVRADCVTEVHGDIIVIRPHEYNRRHEVPEEVLCRALILRAAVEFASMHHVVSRAVWDSKGRFVCYLLIVTSQLRVNDPSINYLRTVGYDESIIFDPRRGLKMAGMGKDWTYTNIKHKSSRVRKVSLK